MHPTHPKQDKNNTFQRFRVTVSQMNKLCLFLKTSICDMLKHKHHHMKVLLSSFHFNGHKLAWFYPQT